MVIISLMRLTQSCCRSTGLKTSPGQRERRVGERGGFERERKGKERGEKAGDEEREKDKQIRAPAPWRERQVDYRTV